MPAQGPITLTKGLVFNPLGKTGNIASYSDDNAVSVAVEPTLTISSTRPSKTSKLFKARYKLTFPISSVDPVTNVATGYKIRESSADVTFIFHETATESERQDTLDQFIALMSDTSIAAAVIVDGQSIY